MNEKAHIATHDLHIHLDLGGLAALMKAIEAAMERGRGRLDLGSGGCGIAARAQASGAFETAIVTFAQPKDPNEVRINPPAPAILEAA